VSQSVPEMAATKAAFVAHATRILYLLHDERSNVPLNTFVMPFTLSTFHVLTSAFIFVAPSKVYDMSVTAPVVHLSTPPPVKLAALSNIEKMVVTLDNDHPPSSAFIATALRNVWSILVTELVIHFSKPVPT